MCCSMERRAICYAGIDLNLGVICFVLGLNTFKDEEINYNNNGLYAMGLWLGVWIILKSLCAVLVLLAPATWRMSCYIALCCISMVTMLVCFIPIITGPIIHYSFEAKANKEYYQQHGPESMRHKPKSYYDERNRVGKKGCGMYGAILVVISVDLIVTALSCHIWKNILSKLQVQQRSRRQQGHPVTINTTNNNANTTPQLVILPYIQDGFAINNEFSKLPRYIDLYPDRSDPTAESQMLEQTSASCDPETASPPPYDEICDIPSRATTENPPDYDALQNDT